MVEQNLEEEFILLEISGEKGNIASYSNILQEAAGLNIKRILLICIWDKEEEKGKSLLKEVIKVCESLDIKPFPSIGGYKNALYKSAMIGTIRKTDGNIIPNINNMISFEDYKKKMAKTDHQILLNAEQAIDRFMQKFKNGEFSSRKEPEDKTKLVKLDEKFIEEQVESFGQLLNDPLMKAVEQDIDKPQYLSFKNETTSNNSNTTD